MRKVVLPAVAVCVGVSVASAVTLKELNIAQDPENLDGAVYATAFYDSDLRDGPGEHFAVIGAVPAGAEVPVVGWIADRYAEGEFWIRTWYGGMRGWICAVFDGEKQITRDGGPLFVLTAKDNIRAVYRGDVKPESGERLEFVSMGYGSEMVEGADDIDFYVKHGDEYQAVSAYLNENGSAWFFLAILYPGIKPGWTVDFEPCFLDLSLTYYYESCDFDFIAPDEDMGGYGGPFGDILFIEGERALVESRDTWDWVRIGTEEEPNVQIYRNFANAECPWPRGGVPEDTRRCCGVHSYVKGDLWPSSNRLYFEIWSCTYDKKVAARHVIESIAVYQPPDAAEAMYATPGFEPALKRGFESGAYVYTVDVPAPFDPGAPFRLVAEMRFEGVQEFEMDFTCSDGE